MIAAFIRANRRLSDFFTPAHLDESNVFHMFAKVASQIVSLPSTTTVLDAGAGASWFFDAEFKRANQVKLIGVDIKESEMLLNDTLDVRLVADVCEHIPVQPESIDAITAFSGIEHFADNRRFLRNAFAALRPGGRLIAQFPSRYALFAVLNRLLPGAVARWMLHHAIPGSDGHLGFKAHYDRTNYSAFTGLAESEGFEVEYYLPGYFDYYFSFFTPLYLFWQLLSILRFGLGFKDLATYNLFVLRKPGPSDALYLKPVQRRKPHLTPRRAVRDSLPETARSQASDASVKPQ